MLYSFYNYGKVGFINRLGEVVIEPKYLRSSAYGEGFVALSESGKFAFFSEDGIRLSDYVYDDVGGFSEGLCYVMVNAHSCYINREIKEEFNVDGCDGDRFKNGFASARKKDSYFYFDRSGVVFLRNGISPGQYSDGKLLWLSSRNRLYGYKDDKGAWSIRPAYEEAGDFSNNMAVVKKGGQWSVIDGNNCLLCILDRISDTFGFISEGLICCIGHNGKYGYVSVCGDLIIPFIYDYATNFSEGFACAKINNRRVYIDMEGDIVIDKDFRVNSDFEGGLAWVITKSGHAGYIDKSGEFVVSSEHPF